MPKFKLCLSRMVEEVATVTIDAASPEDAIAAIEAEGINGAPEEWDYGDEITSERCYCVLDADGNVAWEE